MEMSLKLSIPNNLPEDVIEALLDDIKNTAQERIETMSRIARR